jgi:cystathionine beta-lyase
VAASKAFNLAGLKAAQVIAGSDDTMRRLTERIPIEVTYSAGQLGVIASIAAYREGDAWLDATRERIAANTELLGRLLAEQLPEVGYRAGESTYLAWLDCRGLGLGDDPAAVFLERGRVAVNPGLDFGTQGAGFARLNLATTPEILAEAVRRMSVAIER